ncbi:aspartyl/asparaginyl beta-hydroxylase isoform X3 [Contarinia nasturtii]|uniref:aspartyl/asparaginyl beta-hydroxylase isoform X3 n=1 Tax=Contarinia nasturtii TaxID=265458 RepID=UPI0012D386B2|nr:aspartyl/asparaginyl beta-hydroxylase isoform X3 [Contarinia nasturtii]
MSGDVQPRKRNKDKKRRREDSDVGRASFEYRKLSMKDDDETRPAGVHATKMGPDDIQLHVHSDHGTGGHWCAKIFFFSLLAILLGLIGLILLENRGLSDLDTPLSESRFADMLEGWVDEEREVHDEHDTHAPDEHGDDHENDDEHDQDDDGLANNDDHDEDGTANELTKDDPDDKNDEKDEGFEDANDDDDDDDEGNDDNDDEQSNSLPKLSILTNDTANNHDNTKINTESIGIVKRSIDNNVKLNEDNQSDPVNITVTQLKQQVDVLVENYNKLAKTLNRPQLHETNRKSDGDDGEDKSQEDDEVEKPLETEDDDENDDDDDDNDDNDDTNNDNNDDNDEGIVTGDQQDDNDLDDDSENEIENQDDVDDTPDVDEPQTTDDDGNDIDQPENQPDQETEEESSSLAVRIIVGLALVLVAHQVLIKRPQMNTDDEPKPTSDSETMPDESAELLEMKRRFTLVTAEEPIPSSDEETKEHASLPVDESVKTIESPPIQENPPVNILHSDEEEIDSNQLTPTDDTEPKDIEVDEELISEEEELISSEGHDYDSESSDVDDSDLLKRLDEKYGKLPPPSDEDDPEDGVEDEDIDPTWTNRSGPASFPSDDHVIDDEIRQANEQLAEDPLSALTLFEQIRQTYPASTAAQYGIAKALDSLADLKRSNSLLRRAIEEYEKYINMGDKLNDTEFKVAAERCIERMRFIGEHTKAVPVHEKLIERFDDNPYYRNQLAVTYLLVNRLADAKYVLHMTLQRWRDDGFAAVHYGFVLKNLDHNLEHAVIFLRQGIESGANGTSDGRFYFNLGDALIRLGRQDEAKEIFKEAAKKKLFPSEYQRSLYNLKHLKAQPFWTLAETGYKHEFQTLEQNWKRIRDEGLNLLNDIGYFSDEAENLRDTGVWKQFELFARGKRNDENCKRASFTCKLIETFPAARFCKRGQVKFSVMHPNTHVWPHCGPTNCRLRAHLALKTADKTSIRVATETKTWMEGKIMVFDDSFEHEVWHNGTTNRLILIVDVWHPEISADEKKTLVPI